VLDALETVHKRTDKSLLNRLLLPKMRTHTMSEPEAIYDWMSPQERMARHYRNQGSVEKRKRPYQVKVELTPDEQAAIDALPPTKRLDAYRAKQDAQRG
jgi:hypothetical protein